MKTSVRLKEKLSSYIVRCMGKTGGKGTEPLALANAHFRESFSVLGETRLSNCKQG